jgi:hypothetical protein
VFFDRLDLQFQLTQVGFQFLDLFSLGHEAALEMTALAAAIPSATAFITALALIAALALTFLAVTFLIVMMFTVLAHVHFSFSQISVTYIQPYRQDYTVRGQQVTSWESHGSLPGSYITNGKVSSLPAGGALELDGGVLDAEFGETLL